MRQLYGDDEECVSVDTTDRPTYKFGDANKQPVLSQVAVHVKPGGEKSGNLQVHAHEAKGVPGLLSTKSLASLGAIVNFTTGQAVMQNLNSQKVVQLERSDNGTDHLWFNLFDEMPTVSNDPYDLIDLGRPENMLAQNEYIATPTSPPPPTPLPNAFVTEPTTSTI